MKTRFSVQLTIVLAFLLNPIFAGTLFSQRITCEVALHTERLPQEEQQYLVGLDQKIVKAVEEFRWTEGSGSYELPIRVEIFFEKYSLYGVYHKYGAGVMVATQTGIQLRDKRWEFRLNLSDRLRIGDPYDTFTGLIEFFIQICLGFEKDKFSEHGGQAYYEKARTIAEKARFETKYYLGWDIRRELIEDILNQKSYSNIRKAAFYLEGGEYFLKKKDTETAFRYLKMAVKYAVKSKPDLLELRREGHLIRFIDAKRLADTLKKVEAFGLLDKLAVWDPKQIELYK